MHNLGISFRFSLKTIPWEPYLSECEAGYHLVYPLIHSTFKDAVETTRDPFNTDGSIFIPYPFVLTEYIVQSSCERGFTFNVF